MTRPATDEEVDELVRAHRGALTADEVRALLASGALLPDGTWVLDREDEAVAPYETGRAEGEG